MDPRFISQFGAPAEDQVLLLPLHLKDKVAALVYADAGTGAGGKMDAPRSNCWFRRPAHGSK